MVSARFYLRTAVEQVGAGKVLSIVDLASSSAAFASFSYAYDHANELLSETDDYLAGSATTTTGDSSTNGNTIFARLVEVNQDFRESIRMVPAEHQPTIEFHQKAAGPLAANDIRIKCRYIQQQGPGEGRPREVGTEAE
jgi:hypothetical protein